MVLASVSGAIDYTACDHTRLWWTGAMLRLHVLEQQLYADVSRLHAQRAAAVQGMLDLGLGAQERQEYALAAVTHHKHLTMPWFEGKTAQNNPGEQLDAIAQWYAVFGKELHG